jgi:shikimate kinase
MGRDILQGTGVRILLLADLKFLAERVSRQDRPRVNPGATLEEDLKGSWEEHQEKYPGFADLRYRTDGGKKGSEEVEALLGMLRQGGWVQE